MERLFVGAYLYQQMNEAPEFVDKFFSKLTNQEAGELRKEINLLKVLGMKFKGTWGTLRNCEGIDRKWYGMELNCRKKVRWLMVENWWNSHKSLVIQR